MAVAIAYAREGADVAINYLPEEQVDAEATAQLIREEKRTALLLPHRYKVFPVFLFDRLRFNQVCVSVPHPFSR